MSDRFCERILKESAHQIHRHYDRQGELTEITSVEFINDGNEGEGDLAPSVEVVFAKDRSIPDNIGTYDVWVWQFTKNEMGRNWFSWILTEEKNPLDKDDEPDESPARMVTASPTIVRDAAMISSMRHIESCKNAR